MILLYVCVCVCKGYILNIYTHAHIGRSRTIHKKTLRNSQVEQPTSCDTFMGIEREIVALASHSLYVSICLCIC